MKNSLEKLSVLSRGSQRSPPSEDFSFSNFTRAKQQIRKKVWYSMSIMPWESSKLLNLLLQYATILNSIFKSFFLNCFVVPFANVSIYWRSEEGSYIPIKRSINSLFCVKSWLFRSFDGHISSPHLTQSLEDDGTCKSLFLGKIAWRGDVVWLFTEFLHLGSYWWPQLSDTAGYNSFQESRFLSQWTMTYLS